VYNAGSVKTGSNISYNFRYKNTGRAPLIIQGVETSCECLTVKAPAEPVAPGERGEVEVTWNTQNMTGKQVQTVTRITNGIPERKELSITAEVR